MGTGSEILVEVNFETFYGHLSCHYFRCLLDFDLTSLSRFLLYLRGPPGRPIFIPLLYWYTLSRTLPRSFAVHVRRFKRGVNRPSPSRRPSSTRFPRSLRPTPSPSLAHRGQVSKPSLRHLCHVPGFSSGDGYTRVSLRFRPVVLVPQGPPRLEIRPALPIIPTQYVPCRNTVPWF